MRAAVALGGIQRLLGRSARFNSASDCYCFWDHRGVSAIKPDNGDVDTASGRRATGGVFTVVCVLMLTDVPVSRGMSVIDVRNKICSISTCVNKLSLPGYSSSFCK